MSYYIETYYPFTKDELPAKKTFTIEGIDYGLYIEYNSVGDFYTIQISDTAGNILLTNKITALSALNDCIIKGLNISNPMSAVQYDTPNSTDSVTASTFDKFKIFSVGFE